MFSGVYELTLTEKNTFFDKCSVCHTPHTFDRKIKHRMADDCEIDNSFQNHGQAKVTKFKKAPQAPKRFKSAYMFFSIAKHKEIREQLGEERASKERTTSVAKMVSEAWKKLSDEQRTHWEAIAQKDKVRYEHEKSTYTGPWKVPVSSKRRKKDPSAPKRPMSSYLAYSRAKRSIVTTNNPLATNTEITRLISKMWKEEKEEVRMKFIDEEAFLRKIYKEKMAIWRKENMKGKVSALKEQSHVAAEYCSTQSQVAESSEPRRFNDQPPGETLFKRHESTSNDQFIRAGLGQYGVDQLFREGVPSTVHRMEASNEDEIHRQYQALGGTLSLFGDHGAQQSNSLSGPTASIETQSQQNVQNSLPPEQQITSLVGDPNLIAIRASAPSKLGDEVVPAQDLPPMGQQEFPATQPNLNLQALLLQNIASSYDQQNPSQPQLAALNNNVLDGQQSYISTGQNPQYSAVNFWNFQQAGGLSDIQVPQDNQSQIQEENNQMQKWPASEWPN